MKNQFFKKLKNFLKSTALFLVLLGNVSILKGMEWPQPQPSNQFKIASLNFLDLVAYQHYSQSIPKNLKLTAWRKKEIWSQLLQKQNIKDIDIFCFQEWTRDRRNQQDWEKNLKAIMGKNYLFIHQHQAGRGMGCAVAYNSQKFICKNHQFIKFDASHNMLFVKLTPIQNQQVTLGIINVHLPFNYTPQQMHQQFSQITNKNQNQDVTHWIICGDFNYDTYGKDNFKNYENLYLFSLPKLKINLAWKDVFLYSEIFATAIGSTKGIENLKRFDYMFYSSNFNQIGKGYTYPRPLHLIQHDQGKTNQDQYTYFSDHMILIAEFQIPQQTYQEKQYMPTTIEEAIKLYFPEDYFLQIRLSANNLKGIYLSKKQKKDLKNYGFTHLKRYLQDGTQITEKLEK